MSLIIIFLLSLYKSLVRDAVALFVRLCHIVPAPGQTRKMGGLETGYNASIERFRLKEYPAIKDSVYLDHAGTTLTPKSLMDAFAADMTSSLYGNPHSASEPSQLSTRRVDDVRLALLRFFNADPDEFDLVFVANATAGIKLVLEGARSLPGGYLYAHHEACHTSILGGREEAEHSVCLDDEAVESWTRGNGPFQHQDSNASATLFAYTAQSHMDGRRYPLTWPRQLKQQQQCTDDPRPLYTLLDVASLAATSGLDLSQPDLAADFVVLSLYKIFGFPNLGVLLVRRSAASFFNRRRYFGGGTVDMVIAGNDKWFAPKTQSLHARLEDGTLPFHSIIAAGIALDVHKKLYGSMAQVRSHTAFLAYLLHERLRKLQHANGEPVCVLHTPTASASTPLGVGPIVSFNLRNSAGGWVSLGEFEKLAALKQIHIRTGSLCSPGGTAKALGLTAWDLRRLHAAGYRCGSDNDTITGRPTGVIRASLGAMSIVSDIDRFVDFVEEFFVDNSLPSLPDSLSVSNAQPEHARLFVNSITVYPIKSCGGFKVPKDTAWEVRPEGLAWDREWCLVHKLTGQALSQKRYPKMAHLHPTLDFDQGVLRVRYQAAAPRTTLSEIVVPLLPEYSADGINLKETASQVCGDQVSALAYCSEEVNSFFTEALEVPCVLARFPAGGVGAFSRSIKPSVRHPLNISLESEALENDFPSLPTPPGSDAGQPDDRRLLLSNESPILMVHQASVDALNREIVQRGGHAVSETVFRANIVVGRGDTYMASEPYSEDDWIGMRIGSQDFEVLGPCQRCHMVCVDPKTGQRGQEPYITLAKTRRFDGKVFFGMHMRHNAPASAVSKDDQYPTIRTGQSVAVG